MKRFTITAIFALLASTTMFAQAPPARQKHFNLKDGLAIQGYDPVAFFKQNKAVKGRWDIAVFNQGTTYYFSNPENKEEFKKIRKSTNLNMAAGVLVQWVPPAKK